MHDPSRLNNGAKSKAKKQYVGTNVPKHGETAVNRISYHEPGPEQSSTAGRRFVAPPVDGSRIVSKPVPKAQAENPGEFQLNQLRRRFSPTERQDDGTTTFTFQMVPSDPDFPFDMAALECVLSVPATYPKAGFPSLHVTNKEMERGHQINVERGFARLAENLPDSTLLGLMNALDKQLESLLTEPKAETIKFIPNKVSSKSRQHIGTSSFVQDSKAARPSPVKHNETPKAFTAEQLRLATERRETETRQLEARLGRLPLFSKSPSGIAYTIPIIPRKHEDLPAPLQAVKAVTLIVPLLYPLQNCRIEFAGVSREAATNTEREFEKKANETPETSLVGHMNYLAQNMHILAATPLKEPEVHLPDVTPLSIDDAIIKEEDSLRAVDDKDHSHLKFIPRPPEWNVGTRDDESSNSEYSDSYDTGDESTDNDEDGVPLPTIHETSTSAAPERGISLSFPFLELYGIELLELASLCITIKCERCKDTMDISNLRTDAGRSESCKKCAMPFNVRYRRELMHANSARAGYLDLDGCIVLDMLPR